MMKHQEVQKQGHKDYLMPMKEARYQDYYAMKF